MMTRYCPKCKGMTPHNKAENTKNSPYICEGCGRIMRSKKEIEGK